jgi:hypothetical protein
MLYFRSLEQGLSVLPSASPAVRRRLTEEAARDGWPALHRRLAAVDPEAAARIGTRDAQRIQRALEIHETALRHGFFGNTEPFLYLYIATGEERTALIALAAANAASGINKATAFEYRAMTDPAFDYDAEKTLIEQAYIPAGESEPVIGAAYPDYLLRYRRYDQMQSSELAYWWFPYPLEFRNSPHRKRLMQLTGLPEYWRKHGFPPQCRPLGADDFECD